MPVGGLSRQKIRNIHTNLEFAPQEVLGIILAPVEDKQAVIDAIDFGKVDEHDEELGIYVVRGDLDYSFVPGMAQVSGQQSGSEK